MAVASASPGFSDRLAESLYIEALVLTDETRSYLDSHAIADQELLEPHLRVQFGCEALKATTRLMHITTWLAARRALAAGHVAVPNAHPTTFPPEDSPVSDPATLGALPTPVRRLILAGIDLQGRVARLANGFDQPTSIGSPARALIERLERAF
jgi:regulator of CtrA degradation